ARSLEEAVGAMRRADFNPEREAIVESTALPALPGIRPFTVQLFEPETGHIELHIRSEEPSFLVSSEAWYPGWHALLDGKRTPIYITDAAFLGVLVPPGDHTVSFDFAPAIAWIAALVSIGFIALLVVFLRSKSLFKMVFQDDARHKILDL